MEKLSKAVGRLVDDKVSWAWEKKNRRGLARLDYTQNAINKTLVAPYSARPAAGAPGLRALRRGTSSTTPTSPRPVDDPHRRSTGWPTTGDPLPLVCQDQDCPRCTGVVSGVGTCTVAA